LKKRGADVPAYFDRAGTSNGPTEAINGQPWGDEFGMCVDRFGTSWLVNIAGGG